MAQAAGFGLGSLLAISDGSVGAYSGTSASVIYVFGGVTGFVSTIQSPIVCTVVAKFSLMAAAGSAALR